MLKSNVASRDKLQAYRQLLVNDIRPGDRIFQARHLLNNLSSVDKLLVQKVITFETNTVIDANDDWNYIQPQTSFNYVSLQGKNAPSSDKVSSNGVVITFNEKEHGLFQFVLSVKGLGYRKIGSKWLYLGQGIPAGVDLNSLVDQGHLSNFVSAKLTEYVKKPELQSAQNSQIATNDNFNNRITNDESNYSNMSSATSYSESSLNSTVGYNLYNRSGELPQLSSSTKSGFKSMNQQYDYDVNTLYNDLGNNTQSQITSLTGSLGTSNDTSYYDSYSYSNIIVPPNMARHNASYSYDDSDNEYAIKTPGSVYQEAQLLDSAYGTTSQAIDSVYTSLEPDIERNVVSQDSQNALNGIHNAIYHAETVNNNSYFNPNQSNNVGSVYANASNIASLSTSTSDDKNLASEDYDNLYSFASSNAQVDQPSGYSTQEELMSVKSIQPTNGATILGNGYQPYLDTPNSNNMNSSQLSDMSIIREANLINYDDTNSFIDSENTLPNKVNTNNGTMVNFNSTMMSEAANQGNNITNDARDTELVAINTARKLKGLQPLQFAYENQVVANLRVNSVRYVYHHVPRNLQDNIDIHGEESIDNGISAYASRISDALGFTDLLSNIAENVASWRMGKETYADPGYDYPHYTNNNGTDVANNLIDVYLNHDQSANNGHRINLLNPKYRYIGISYYYDPVTKQGIEVEELSENTGNSAYIPRKVNTQLVNLFVTPFNETGREDYNKYLLSNDISVTPGETYSISGTFDATSLGQYGVLGVSTSPYLAQYDSPLNAVEKNGKLDGQAVTFNIDKHDIDSEVNMGYIHYTFTPKPGITHLWLVGIPLIEPSNPTYNDIQFNHVKLIDHVQPVNSLASENATNITALAHQTSVNGIVIGNMANSLYSLSSASSNIDSLNNNPLISLVATKSMASSLSTDSSEANQIYIYPRFTSATGDNSRTEELAINWCNDAYYGDIQICEQDFEGFVQANYQKPENMALEQYHENVKNYARSIADVNKDKVAAILGILQTKTEFGQNIGGDANPNYIGYRDYRFEYNNIYDYLSNILQHTIGGWAKFSGTLTWNDGPVVGNLQMSDFQPFVTSAHPLEKDQLPYFYAAWLDYQIDNSNTDTDECGENALDIKKILY